ncbi:hypothetical protein Q8A67_021850 [Cirrhinus molitorella]|uniref:Uncharacterized protein n=1 Tax=Cirrhinus molitorella TaxID=172907 RepID=A0AA88PAR1_9TELE|nr:hypothetical protein Q8A67_021850 [Cirrhinus molitorella]
MRPKHCKQEVVSHTGYPDKAVVSIATPSCATSQPIGGQTLTGQEDRLVSVLRWLRSSRHLTRLVLHV